MCQEIATGLPWDGEVPNGLPRVCRAIAKRLPWGRECEEIPEGLPRDCLDIAKRLSWGCLRDCLAIC